MTMANQAKRQENNSIAHIQTENLLINRVAHEQLERRGRRPNSVAITSDNNYQQHSTVRVPLGIEHRQGRRCNLIALTTIQLRDQHYSGIITNVSANGMFVLTEAKLRINECVDLHIRHPKMTHAPLRFPGLVVHAHDNGFGMIFRELDDDAHQQVSWWLSEK